MMDSKRFLLIVGLFLIQDVAVDAQITTQPYQYNGGTFTITTVFNFDTSIETDGIAGTTDLQPLITITNTSTGRSIKTSYISESDYISRGEGNILIGRDVDPGGQNPRTNIGLVAVNASSLGPGPLVFSAALSSQLFGSVPIAFRNSFGGPFYVWTISPQSITPSLSPYVPPPSGPPPVRGPVATSIHAVIISGRSDPTKIVTSQNVTLVGGVVALGKDPAPPTAPNPWSSGLRILPDEGLLTGAKIPPLTPNILDVRIAKHAVVGDLTESSASPSP
jgi:hypothetical protein